MRLRVSRAVLKKSLLLSLVDTRQAARHMSSTCGRHSMRLRLVDSRQAARDMSNTRKRLSIPLRLVDIPRQASP